MTTARRRREGWIGALVLAGAMPVLAGAQDQAAVIDRIVAVVDGRPITHSDVVAVTTLGLVGVVPTVGESPRPIDRLINRELVLAEVRRYEPAPPAPEQVRARLQQVRDRLASPDALRAAMAASAMTESRLEGFVRDDLRVEAYIAQRFASPTIPTDEELVRYYREHEADYRRDGTVVPFDEAREGVRQRLLDEQRQGLVISWLAGLQRRADILVFEAPPRCTTSSPIGRDRPAARSPAHGCRGCSACRWRSSSASIRCEPS
jgi:hypothetical protein